MEQIHDSWGPDHFARCGPCMVNEIVRELADYHRACSAAIAHLVKHDAAGALSVLTTQRDAPDLFRRSRYEGDRLRGTAADVALSDTALIDFMQNTIERGNGKALTIGGVCYFSVCLGRKRIGAGEDVRDALADAIAAVGAA
jgi:hypothetical protein